MMITVSAPLRESELCVRGVEQRCGHSTAHHRSVRAGSIREDNTRLFDRLHCASAWSLFHLAFMRRRCCVTILDHGGAVKGWPPHRRLIADRRHCCGRRRCSDAPTDGSARAGAYLRRAECPISLGIRGVSSTRRPLRRQCSNFRGMVVIFRSRLHSGPRVSGPVQGRIERRVSVLLCTDLPFAQYSSAQGASATRPAIVVIRCLGLPVCIGRRFPC
jgi:hypothetical protein